MKIAPRRIFGILLVVLSILITVDFCVRLFGHLHVLGESTGMVGDVHVMWMHSEYSQSPVNYLIPIIVVGTPDRNVIALQEPYGAPPRPSKNNLKIAL